MNIAKFNIHDEVLVEGKEGIFKVEAYFEQLFVDEGIEKFELWYTVRDKKYGGINEVRYNLVKSADQKKIENMNELLDEYNDCLRLEILFSDSEYGVKAKDTMKRIKHEQ